MDPFFRPPCRPKSVLAASDPACAVRLSNCVAVRGAGCSVNAPLVCVDVDRKEILFCSAGLPVLTILATGKELQLSYDIGPYKIIGCTYGKYHETSIVSEIRCHVCANCITVCSQPGQDNCVNRALERLLSTKIVYLITYTQNAVGLPRLSLYASYQTPNTGGTIGHIVIRYNYVTFL